MHPFVLGQRIHGAFAVLEAASLNRRAAATMTLTRCSLKMVTRFSFACPCTSSESDFVAIFRATCRESACMSPDRTVRFSRSRDERNGSSQPIHIERIALIVRGVAIRHAGVEPPGRDRGSRPLTGRSNRVSARVVRSPGGECRGVQGNGEREGGLSAVALISWLMVFGLCCGTSRRGTMTGYQSERRRPRGPLIPPPRRFGGILRRRRSPDRPPRPGR